MILGNRLATIILRLIGRGTGSPAGGSFRVEVVQNGPEWDAIREDEIGGDFKQRPEHKPAVFHVVMRNGETFSVNGLVTKQHNVEVQRARSPAFGFAHPPLLQLDALGVIEQRFWRE